MEDHEQPAPDDCLHDCGDLEDLEEADFAASDAIAMHLNSFFKTPPARRDP
jgi:hypothetical protein